MKYPQSRNVQVRSAIECFQNWNTSKSDHKPENVWAHLSRTFALIVALKCSLASRARSRKAGNNVAYLTWKNHSKWKKLTLNPIIPIDLSIACIVTLQLSKRYKLDFDAHNNCAKNARSKMYWNRKGLSLKRFRNRTKAGFTHSNAVVR